MNRKFFIFLILLLLPFQSVFALKREYGFVDHRFRNQSNSSSKDDLEDYRRQDRSSSSSKKHNKPPNYYGNSTNYCFYHAFLKKYGEEHAAPPGISKEELSLIPSTRDKCFFTKCKNKAIYVGYLDYNHRSYMHNLSRQLEYCRENKQCRCYWPETSSEAAEINNKAYDLFNDLVSTTSLVELMIDSDEQKNFCRHWNNKLTEHGFIVTLINHQFQFSDYYFLCRDLEEYAKIKYNVRMYSDIKEGLDDILETLYNDFFHLYSSCIAKHPHPRIARELQFMRLLMEDVSVLEEMPISMHLESKGEESKKAEPNVVLESEILLKTGILLNDAYRYKEAVVVLTDAINANPSNQLAYLERAAAYFELGKTDLAVRDFEQSKKLMTTYPCFQVAVASKGNFCEVMKETFEFSKGLSLGGLEGAKVAATEFLPSMWSMCQSLLHGIWSFVSSPKETSKYMLNSAYEMGIFLSDLSADESLELFIPEVRVLAYEWKTLNDYTKGKQIGYIIGKYGVEVFAPATGLKAISKYRALRQASTMVTLEGYIATDANKAIILEERARRLLQQEKLVEAAKKGKIIPRNPNVQPHVMLKKHAWERVIKLTGDQGEDFKRVLLLLEEHAITSEQFLENVEKFSSGAVVKEFRKIINNETVQVFFFEDVKTGELLLIDGWVVAK